MVVVDPPAPLVRTFYGSALWESLAASDPVDRMQKLALYPLEWLGGLRASSAVAVSEHVRSCFPFIDLVIPCGVDLDVFYPGEEKTPDPTILFVGMLEGRERGRFLQEIFEKEVRPVLPRAQLWLVCGTEFSLPGVKAFSYVTEQRLAEMYRQAWVFCLPSTYEGFGASYLEAMASGTPVVATPNPGALEVLEEGRYGLLVSDESLGLALAALLRDQGRRQFFARLGLKRCRIYAWEQVVSAYEELFEKIYRAS
jgi:glycosyltransferase involved in cell wall biosynthesis